MFMYFGDKLEDLICQACGQTAVLAKDIKEHEDCTCRSCGTAGLIRYIGDPGDAEVEPTPPEPIFMVGRDAAVTFRLTPERAAASRKAIEDAIAEGMLPAPPK